MEKKTYLLSNLKKQVVALKMQLETLEKKDPGRHNRQSYHSKNHRSITHSSRFDSVSLDCSDLDKGKKKFSHCRYQFKNLAEVIREKSAVLKVPAFSVYRRAENERTRQIFSSEKVSACKTRSRSPNPIMGEGYKEKRRGVRMVGPVVREGGERVHCRRHFRQITE